MRWRSLVVAAISLTFPYAVRESNPAAGRTLGSALQSSFPRLPARDAQPTKTGTARITGRVLRADGSPVRRALVLLYGPEVRDGRPVMTDAQGTFDSGDLPAGSYHVTVTKEGLLNAEFGSKIPGEAGQAVTVQDAEKLEKIDVVMYRGGAITGRVLDEYGEGVPLAMVRVLRDQTVEGVRRLVPTGGMAMPRTDDLGQYRVFGLPPGRYFVAASAPHDSGPPVDAPDRTGLALTYYPGTINISQARAIDVAADQDQNAIDIPLLLVRTARVSGLCFDLRGRPLVQGFVTFSAVTLDDLSASSPMTAAIGADGTFSLSDVPPGEYQAVVRGNNPLQAGEVRVAVAGSDVSGITIQATAGSTLSGEIVVEGGLRRSGLRPSFSTRPADLDALSAASFGDTQFRDDGSFTLTGLFGQRYLGVFVKQGITVKTIYHRGRDVTDLPFTFDGREAITGVQVVLTDRITHVTVTIAADTGGLPDDARILVVPDDPARWNPGLSGRYLRHQRPDPHGSVTFDALPPGDYFVVAVADRDPSDLADPMMLERLRGSGQRFTLSEGETKSIGVRVSK